MTTKVLHLNFTCTLPTICLHQCPCTCKGLLQHVTFQVVCESRWGNSAGAQFEYTLVATFLASLSMREVRAALAWCREAWLDREARVEALL